MTKCSEKGTWYILKQMKLNLEQKVDLLLEGFSRQEAVTERLVQSSNRHEAAIDRLVEGFERQEATLDSVAIEVVNLRGDVDGLTSRVGSLERKFDEGFTKLDAFVQEMSRQRKSSQTVRRSRDMKIG